MLRLQNERMQGPRCLVRTSTFRYGDYGKTTCGRQVRCDCHATRAAQSRRRNCINVADGNQSVILQQVSFGIVVRMAVMSTVWVEERVFRCGLKSGGASSIPNRTPTASQHLHRGWSGSGAWPRARGFRVRPSDATGLIACPGLIELGAYIGSRRRTPWNHCVGIKGGRPVASRRCVCSQTRSR